MLFNSIEFLLFLPIVFILYWLVNYIYKSEALPNHERLANIIQNSVLIIASYIFYGWIDPKFCILIAATTITTYLSGIAMKNPIGGGKNASESDIYNTIILWLTIALNLSILGFFKYYNFFVDNIVSAFQHINVIFHAETLNIILPAGISFYTFTALSYTIDVRRGTTKAIQPTIDGILSYIAYVCFFPQLLAGPIGRSTTLLPQFTRKKFFDYATAADGLRQMLWGFFKKVVVADNCAVYVNQVWDSYTTQSGSTLLLAAILFTIQIYGDFSGYSDIAIGTAKLFNIKLTKNFNYPYFSRDIAEFWRRWHISLTSWFRDYIYIPLGGSRTTKAKIARNTIIVFLVSGFWHGANWTFIAWGAYHAILFLPLILTNRNKRNKGTVAEQTIFPTIKESIRIIITFTLVTIGWILFRADNIHQAFSYISGMFQLGTIKAIYRFFIQTDVWRISWLAIIMFIVEWHNRINANPLDFIKRYPRYITLPAYLLIAFAIFWFYSDANTFIYAQF